MQPVAIGTIKKELTLRNKIIHLMLVGLCVHSLYAQPKQPLEGTWKGQLARNEMVLELTNFKRTWKAGFYILDILTSTFDVKELKITRRKKNEDIHNISLSIDGLQVKMAGEIRKKF